MEIAKNIVLLGVKEVAIYDPTIASIADLGSNFYLTEASVGKISRAEGTIPSLKTLNPYVGVCAIPEISNEIAKRYSVIIVSELLLKISQLKAMNEDLRKNGIHVGFILALGYGLSASIFTDFSQNHIIKDNNGVPTKLNYVLGITNENSALVTVIPGTVRIFLHITSFMD